ncbi:CLUMA_CG009295, isoform A [Clunio marinus]|uniref:CLUMA_CG009295, isoform A n=1 Tax=Clunio marinus TaxID=568069 RepID=A0A1J1I699_9DIPT|nr:CLUMA_CG009295, isoform A [Clunio marinus]
MEKSTIMIDNNRVPSNEFPDMMGFVSIDNRPEFFIDLLNSTYLNDTFMYNVTNTSQSSFDGKNEESNTLEFILMSLVTVLLGILILITIIGNVFVIIAVLIEKHLQNSGNYLVASLAVADLLVACLVMPMAAIYEIQFQNWVLGSELCEIWTSADVLLCTCSILHLVVIALDRYWFITDVNYSRTNNRIFGMIALVWLVSILIALPPVFGWKDENYHERIENHKCMISQDIGYQIFATLTTFYLPLIFILVLYWRIYQAARKRINKRKIETSTVKKLKKSENPKPHSTPKFRFKKRIKVPAEDWDSSQNSEAKASMRSSTKSESNCNNSDNMNNNTIEVEDDRRVADDAIDVVTTDCNNKLLNQSGNSESELKQRAEHVENDNSAKINVYEQIARRKEHIASEREARVQRVLTIITSAFLLCWAPFFLSVLMSTIFHFDFNILNSFFLWLGYFNSSLNPILYNIFNPEFRAAFKKILLGQNHKHSFYKRQKL